jgi:hypothetical protein
MVEGEAQGSLLGKSDSLSDGLEVGCFDGMSDREAEVNRLGIA